MPTPLIALILFGLGFWYWSAARAAAERAQRIGRNACQTAGVQWLDQTVHAEGLRLRRGPDGRLGFERTFRFEYSETGEDRHIGRMVLRGERLLSFSGPTKAAAVLRLH